MVKLLVDEDTRDAILDHELLAKAFWNLLNGCRSLRSCCFTFFAERFFATHRVKSRDAADFVASVLEGFYENSAMEASDETGRRSMQYLSDIMQAMNNAGTREAFLLRSHAANYALFISGIFADNVEMRTRQRGAPDLPSTRLSAR